MVNLPPIKRPSYAKNCLLNLALASKANFPAKILYYTLLYVLCEVNIICMKIFDGLNFCGGQVLLITVEYIITLAEDKNHTL